MNAAWHAVSDLVGSNLAAVIGILAAVTYAYLRLLQVNFYRQIGVTPEDVGLGYAETLSKGFVAVVVLAVFIIVLVGLGVLAIGIGDWAAAKVQKSLHELRIAVKIGSERTLSVDR